MIRKRILIIDDDPSFLQVTEAILKQADYQVDTALGSQEGLGKMLSEKPDLLILDIMMVTMDEGLNFALELKKHRELRQVPILIASARPDTEKGYKRQLDDDMDWIAAEIFMEKPIDPQDLLHNVGMLLRQ